MEKRFFLALLLAAAVVAVTQILFPVTRPALVTRGKNDSTSTSKTQNRSIGDVDRRPAVVQPTSDSTFTVTSAATSELTTLVTPKSIYRFSDVGAAPVSVALRSYKNLAPAGGAVELGIPGQPLLRYALVVNGDTTRFDSIPFRSRVSTNQVTYDAIIANHDVEISYQILPDKYVVRVNGKIERADQNAYLLIQLPTGLRPAEADTISDLRNLAFSFKPERENARIVRFGSLDPGEQRLETGPLVWAAVKNKYFVLGLLTPSGSSFNEVTLRGGPRMSKVATTASATIVELLKTGSFTLDLYAGPQQSTELIAMGRDFDHVNPYGWRFLQGVVQPIAALCIRLLLWMHQVLRLSYGWVLIIFGILIRVALWPLNQSAMRSSMKMQEIQPKLAEVQKKYKDKPEKQREEIMKVYRDAGASPFTALTGCLPALIPMPVLFALFFVFQNTIEFRGVPFMWLHDISIKDPLYILPILMGVSMYVLSWIGLRNAPPNPQAKTMSYMFPVMMTFILANMASGLNLYYTAQNLAAIPQQWLLAQERARRKPLSRQ